MFRFSEFGNFQTFLPAACGMVFRRVEFWNLGTFSFFWNLHNFQSFQNFRNFQNLLDLQDFQNFQNFLSFQNFSDFSDFLEFPYFQNFQSFQVFQIFKMLLELIKLQKSFDTFSIFIGFSCFCSSSFNFTSGPGITWLRLVVCKTWFYLFYICCIFYLVAIGLIFPTAYQDFTNNQFEMETQRAKLSTPCERARAEKQCQIVCGILFDLRK